MLESCTVGKNAIALSRPLRFRYLLATVLPLFCASYTHRQVFSYQILITRNPQSTKPLLRIFDPDLQHAASKARIHSRGGTLRLIRIVVEALEGDTSSAT